MANSIELLPRIKDQIAVLQYKSELLVAAVQLGVIALLFVLNYVTPSSYSPSAPVHSAVLGLSLFTILVLLRLWFAYTHQLTPLFLGFSVIAEMALLLFTIWTYYLQYETTAPINLKSPQFVYVFVLIAMRALRFEPKWIILSGLTAIIGWIIIVCHTLRSTGMDVITWDYVTYASTRSVYLGAEFNKILAVLLVTSIIALVVQQAKKVLLQAVSQTTAAHDLSRFFDIAVANKITTSETILQTGYGEMRQAAILFTDLRGFTKASKTLSPSDLIALLSKYQRLIVPIIQKHNGNIDKFMGDGIMASFGAVSSSETYAADALNAADEIIIAVNNWNEARRRKEKFILNVGIGLAVGEVIFGVMGNEERLEYTVIGEAANLAAKVEKQNKIQYTQALTTSIAFKQALQQGYKNSNKEQLPACKVAGVDEPVDLVILC